MNLIRRLWLSEPRRLYSNPLPGFDPIYYCYWYRDVSPSPTGPLDHFLTRGWMEGRDPSPGFSTRGYLNANPDVAREGVNPLLHFLEHGLSEGRMGWQKDPGQAPPQPGPTLKLLAPPRPDA